MIQLLCRYGMCAMYTDCIYFSHTKIECVCVMKIVLIHMKSSLAKWLKSIFFELRKTPFSIASYYTVLQKIIFSGAKKRGKRSSSVKTDYEAL